MRLHEHKYYVAANGTYELDTHSALISAESRLAAIEQQVDYARNIDTSMVDQFLVFLKQVKPDVVRDFHIWLEAKKKVGG